MLRIVILGELVDLNNYIYAERTNKYNAAKIKKHMTDITSWHFRNLQLPDKRYRFIFTWYCKDRMKDPDNICFAKKFILDGLVNSGAMKNDGWKQVAGFIDNFELDPDNPRIIIELMEVP